MPDMTNLEDRIEAKLDKTAIAGTAIAMGFGGVKFQTMIELMEFAKLMSLSQLAVPYHLRNNPGACLAICTKALRFGFDPFALAEHSFSMKKDVDVPVTHEGGGRSTQKVPVETIAYDSYVIRAVIEAHAPIKGRLKYAYAGDGDARKCTVSATLLEDGSVISMDSPTLGDRKKAIGTSEKGYLRGSPLWISKPDQQLAYDTARDLCRRHFPEILMGWYDKDEFEENPRTIEVETPDVGKRLRERSKGKEGFEPAKIAHQMTEVVPEKAREAVPVEAGGQPQPEPSKATDDSGEAQSTIGGKEVMRIDTSGVHLDPKTVNQDDPMAVMQDAQTEKPKKAPKEKKAAKPKEPEPKDEVVKENAMQRGLRLLPAQKTREAVEDLRGSIAEELGSDEAQPWHDACDTKRNSLGASK